MDTEGEGEGETNWESGGGSYTLLCVKWTASGKLSQCREPSSVLGDDLQGGVGWVGERFMREWKFKKKKDFIFQWFAAGVGEYDGSVNVALSFCDFAQFSS